MSTEPEESQEQEMTFLEHLEELRWHIIRALISIAIFAVIAFIAKEIVFGIIILGPSRPDFWTYEMFCKLGRLTGTDYFCIDDLPFIIQNRRMTAQFTMHLTSSFVVGIICAFPYVFWEIWRFVSPGLYSKERNISRGAVFFVSLLFITGVLFGYYIIAPISINFLSHYQLDPSILNEIDLTSYVSTVTMIVLASGLMFQLPVVVFFLSKVGLITPEVLKTYRRHAIVIILVLSALITPPDIISQILMSFPLIFLYEISIVLSKFVTKKEQEALEKALN